jgi:hypothetical protein
VKGAPILLLLGVGVAAALAVTMTSRSAAETGPGPAPGPSPDPAPSPDPEPVTACSNLRGKVRALSSAEVEKLRSLCRSSPGGACLELVPALEEASRLTAQLEGCAPGSQESPCREGWSALAELLSRSVPAMAGACSSPGDSVCAELLRFRREIEPLSAKWLAECAPPAQAKIPVPRGEIGAEYTQGSAEGLQTILEYLATRSAAL